MSLWAAVTRANTRNNSFRLSRWLHTINVLLGTLVLVPLAAVDASAAAGQQWFSAWTVAQAGRLPTSMSGTSVRMIVRPTISGSAVRVKLENRFGQSSVVFSAADIG